MKSDKVWCCAYDVGNGIKMEKCTEEEKENLEKWVDLSHGKLICSRL
jgi:hypothetical protein